MGRIWRAPVKHSRALRTSTRHLRRARFRFVAYLRNSENPFNPCLPRPWGDRYIRLSPGRVYNAAPAISVSHYGMFHVSVYGLVTRELSIDQE